MPSTNTNLALGVHDKYSVHHPLPKTQQVQRTKPAFCDGEILQAPLFTTSWWAIFLVSNIEGKMFGPINFYTILFGIAGNLIWEWVVILSLQSNSSKCRSPTTYSIRVWSHDACQVSRIPVGWSLSWGSGQLWMQRCPRHKCHKSLLS